MSKYPRQEQRFAGARIARIATLCLSASLSALAGCSFDEEEPSAPPNTCSLPTDCAADLTCQVGVCVTPAINAPLDVTLEITPKRMPDGSQPFPILYGPFALQGGGPGEFSLDVPSTVMGTVHQGIQLLNAQLTFVPTKAPPKLATPIQARSSINILRPKFSVQLLAGVEYRVTVQPVEHELPPYSKVFTASASEEIDIDYAKVPQLTQTFVIRNLPVVPDGQSLNIRARSQDGQLLSNTVAVGEGRVALTFSQESLPDNYSLEIIVDQSFAARLNSGGNDCGETQGLVPSFTIDSSAVKREASTNSKATAGVDYVVDLPTLPPTISYEGTIHLCQPQKNIDNLLVSLRSSALALNSMTPGISASYSVTTSASDVDDSTQSFCTRVVPGEYVVLVTPPAAVNCEIFAERRQILRASDEPDSLELRVPAKLSGKILDSQMRPIANATIDAVALGIDTTMMVADNDATVPIYNRSRQTSSGSNGAFSFYVDVGVYDLIVKPPAQSGFAWQIQPGLNVGGSRNEDLATRVEVGAPALIKGGLRYADGKNRGTLAGAEVHAYTVEDEKMPTARGVEIGHTQADENGNILLFVSPEPQPPW
jgi:hypothetical protein